MKSAATKDFWKLYSSLPEGIKKKATEYLRRMTKDVALKIGDELKDEVESFMKYCKSEGYSDNSYKIFFSIIMDNLVWDEFDDVKIFNESREKLPESPSWSGLIYALYPKREVHCGTNSSRSKGVSLGYNWTKDSLDIISKVRNDSAVSDLFKDLQEYGEFKNEEAIKVCKSLKICDSNGNLKIPVIEEDKTDDLYSECKKLAEKIANQVEYKLDFEKIENEFGVKGKAETIIIVYHEIMWVLLDYLESEKIIKKPKIFADPENAKEKDVADVMFVIFQKPEEE